MSTDVPGPVSMLSTSNVIINAAIAAAEVLVAAVYQSGSPVQVVIRY